MLGADLETCLRELTVPVEGHPAEPVYLVRCSPVPVLQQQIVVLLGSQAVQRPLQLAFQGKNLLFVVVCDSDVRRRLRFPDTPLIELVIAPLEANKTLAWFVQQGIELLLALSSPVTFFDFPVVGWLGSCPLVQVIL